LELGALKSLQNENSEIYPIGMTLLSVGLTENLDSTYNMTNYSIRENTMHDYLMQWKSTLYYSEILRALICNLVEHTQENRLTFEELSLFLQPHKNNILLHKPLTINNAPNKLHRQVNLLRKEVPQSVQERFDK